MARTGPLELVPSGGSRSLGELDDEELMLLVKGGHEAALGILVDRHQAAVVGFARCYLGDEGLVGDVAQEVFLALWTQARSYRAQGSLRAYLLGIARNHCRMAARSRDREQRRREALRSQRQVEPLEEADAVEGALERERLHLVRDQLRTLPPKERDVLILRYHSELHIEEISGILKMPVGTVKSHIFRGLRRLRHQLAGRLP